MNALNIAESYIPDDEEGNSKKRTTEYTINFDSDASDASSNTEAEKSLPCSVIVPTSSTLSEVSKSKGEDSSSLKNTGANISTNKGNLSSSANVNTIADIDSLILCRQSGEGRIRLEKSLDVWIDKTELDFCLRWSNKPKEMSRRLLILLVGSDNLVYMTALGRKYRNSKRDTIPRDI